MAYYLDTPAVLKLGVAETESAAMRSWFTAEGRSFWSSQLLVSEAMRAADRLGLDPLMVEEALDAVALVLSAATTFHLAATVIPRELRTLDPSISPPLWSLAPIYKEWSHTTIG